MSVPLKKMKREELEKIKNTHICHLCGKEIYPDEPDPVYIKTRRRTELYIHQQCMDRTKTGHGGAIDESCGFEAR